MMEKIRLLVADDETNIRNAICNMIQWENYGIVICGVAKDGREAMELIEKKRADIALLDIRMPYLSGLEVLSRIKERHLPTRAILLTGYDDFAYAREALLQNAENYLLKPSRPSEILAAVMEVKDKLTREKIREQQFKETSSELESSRYEIKNKRIADFILTSDENGVRSCEEKCGYGIGEKAVCLVIKPSEKSVFLVSQQQFAIEYLEEKLSCAAGCVAENIVAVIGKDEIKEKKRLRQTLIDFRLLISNRYAIAVSVGIGNAVSRSDGLGSSYRNALKALDMIHFLGSEFIIFYDSIYDTQSNAYPYEIERELLEAVKKQDIAACNQKVDEFFKVSSKDNPGVIVKNTIAILLSLYYFTVTSGLDADILFGRPLEIMEHIQKSKNPEELVRKIKSQCTWIVEQFSSGLTENRFVNAAILYIHQNYQKNITLTMVADAVFITPGYLSTLFKQTTKDSFINYLNKIRVEKACELLRDISMKTYEVAYRSGFQDEKYFTKVFKKITGKSPSQFKNSSYR